MAAEKKAAVLRVVAKTEVFRRAGFTFTREPKDIPMDTFDGKEGKTKLDLLKNESMLFCTETEVAVADVAAG